MNEKGKLSDEKIANTDPADCFVRFSVDGKKLWKDESLYQAYIAYACGDCATSDICYATGEHGGITYKHPSKIRNTGDKAKLFSTNDESGFHIEEDLRIKLSLPQSALTTRRSYTMRLNA